ncbi:MAG TPA: ABC transporter ATP-binding protein [Rhabdochlamydiaceae bacterium]|jgi:ABC-2 type transport system ATP-binding protein
MSPILSIKQLKKVYYNKKKPLVAVDAISFDLQPSEILGLLGPNGSGKTTTIQMLLGTLAATSGEISYFGRDFFKYRSDILQDISFASTYTSLPYLLTIEENLRCFGHLFCVENALEKAEPLLKRFGIYDKRKEKVAALSAGQVTRLMLVKAFFTDPKVVLLDEPTASLDPDIARDVCAFLLEQRQQRGVSIVFTSHKMEEVAQVCDRVIVLKNGKIIADDLPKNLAKSISFHRVRLHIADGMKRIIALAERHRFSCHVDQRVFLCTLEEAQIPAFLQLVMQEGISYSSIQIEEPSLEDYFLKIAGDL